MRWPRRAAACSPSCRASARSSAPPSGWQAASAPIPTSCRSTATSTARRRMQRSGRRLTGRRKVVLATSIAETSITIDGVRVVVDCGLSRLPKYEPATGITRLETVRVSRASADQRAGRAGRTQPGVAIRLWRAEQTAALPAFAPPEILEADLSGLLLDCAAFGVVRSGDAFPSSIRRRACPQRGAGAARRRLTRSTPTGRITDERPGDAEARAAGAAGAHGQRSREVRRRRARRRCWRCCSPSAGSAATVPISNAGCRDLQPNDRRAPTAARQLAERLARQAGGKAAAGVQRQVHAGALLIHAWPDRVAMARGERGRFVLSNGRGAMLDAADPLAGEKFLVVADLQGKAQNARIVSAAAISRGRYPRRARRAHRDDAKETLFDLEKRAVRVRETERLGAIVLGRAPAAGADRRGRRSRDPRCAARAWARSAAMGQGSRDAAPSAGLAASRARRALAR